MNTYTATYSKANRLASVANVSPAISAIVYDAFGLRYSKQDSGSTPIQYAYDQSGNLLEENNSGAVTDYVYLNGMPLALFVPGGSAGTLYFIHTDRQGTPQLVTDASQTPQWSTTYQPYGTTPTIVSSIVQNLRFPGQYFDLEMKRTCNTTFNATISRISRSIWRLIPLVLWEG